MRVILAFDDKETSEIAELGDAFWLVDSPANRGLAEAAWGSGRYDPDSAVFTPPSGAVQPPDIVQRLDDVELHHPDWREIMLSGVAMTKELQTILEDRKLIIERRAAGFLLKK